MTPQKTAVEAVFSDPFLHEYILQMAQALQHAKDMCKKIYIPWDEDATHRSISTAFSEEEEDQFFYFNGDSPKEKIWYFSLTTKHYLDSGLKKVLLGDGDIFKQKILSHDSSVFQTIVFAETEWELEKRYSLFAARR